MSQFETLHTAICACIQTGNPVCLKSHPGMGKNAYIMSIAKTANRYLEHLIPSRCDQTDFGGIPYNDNGKMRISVPWFVQRVLDQNRSAAVLFDEVTNAPRTVLGAMLDGIQTGVWGAGALPKGTWQFMACNPPETAAEGIDLPAPFANRIHHFDWRPSTKEFTRGLTAGWPEYDFIPVKKDWEVGIAKWRSIVAGYLDHKPGDAYKIPEEEAKRSGPWPSYRSWDDLVVKSLAALDSMMGSAHAVRDIQLTIVASAVGDAYGLSFFGWMDSLDLPDLEELLRSPGKFEPHWRGDINFTVLTSIAQVVAENCTPDRYMAGWDVMEVAAKKGLVDCACTAARALALIRSKTPSLPLPKTQLQPFIQMLQKAGMLQNK